jgi:hypothetical protein
MIIAETAIIYLFLACRPNEFCGAGILPAPRKSAISLTECAGWNPAPQF